ncbi:MAG: hypothetical protein GEU74_04445 [Nitriliruptorales bacterium]|nr:hypothetical protein [Nitriliruptorales bacterium]
MASSVAAPTGVVAARERACYTRVAVQGLLFLAAAPALFLAGALATGMDIGAEGTFFGVAMVVALVAAAVEWRFRLPGRITGIVVSLVMAGMLFWLAFGLFAPTSFLEFTGATLFVLGFVMALAGSIAAIVQQRRGHVAAAASGGELRIIRGALVVVAVAALVSGVLSIAARSTVDSAAAAGATTVDMSNFQFAPRAYEMPAGETTKLLIHNRDAFMHDFTITALGVGPISLGPGSQQLVEVNAPAGDYLIRCTLHSGSSEDPSEAQGDSMTALLTAR